MMGAWENHGENPWGYHGEIMEKSWGYHGDNPMGIILWGNHGRFFADL